MTAAVCCIDHVDRLAPWQVRPAVSRYPGERLKYRSGTSTWLVMPADGQTLMAAPGPSVRPPRSSPQKPSRLPLHRSRPSTDMSSRALPTSPVSGRSHTSLNGDASQRSEEHLINGSRPAHKSDKTTQVGLNRMSLQNGQGAAADVRPRRRPHLEPQPRQRDATGVVHVNPAAATEQNHLGNAVVINHLKV